MAAQKTQTPFESLPRFIISTLDDMAFGISQQEGEDSYEVKQRMVANINKLAPGDVEYLKEQLSILINKSVHQGENIDDSNVDKDFVTFLIRLYY